MDEGSAITTGAASKKATMLVTFVTLLVSGKWFGVDCQSH